MLAVDRSLYFHVNIPLKQLFPALKVVYNINNVCTIFLNNLMLLNLLFMQKHGRLTVSVQT